MASWPPAHLLAESGGHFCNLALHTLEQNQLYKHRDHKTVATCMSILTTDMTVYLHFSNFLRGTDLQFLSYTGIVLPLDGF